MPDPIPKSAGHQDVRMRGFTDRSRVQEVWNWLDECLRPLSAETVSLGESAGRVLAEPIVSRWDVPGFARAMMDGYALIATDTLGASSYNPLNLRIVGESMPGQGTTVQVAIGGAVRIMTGAPLPTGADAVLPVEQVDVDGDILRVYGEVSPGKHVGTIGEDVPRGTSVFNRSRRLRPQDLGVLASIGEGRIPVIRRPRVRIVVTGNELLPPGSQPEGHRIVDANSPMLRALIARDGGQSIHPGIVQDDPEAILAAIRGDADVVLISGGSSVGQEDHAPALVARYGELPFHGIAMRPSSPAGAGFVQGHPVFLLPGNPVSCLCAYDFFAGRAIRALAGLPVQWPYRKQTLPLERKLVSVVGRLDYARIRIDRERAIPLAVSGASILTSTTRADGFVVIPEDSEGYPAEAEVNVWLYDGA